MHWRSYALAPMAPEQMAMREALDLHCSTAGCTALPTQQARYSWQGPQGQRSTGVRLVCEACAAMLTEKGPPHAR